MGAGDPLERARIVAEDLPTEFVRFGPEPQQRDVGEGMAALM